MYINEIDLEKEFLTKDELNLLELIRKKSYPVPT
jgi:hypothetical protein